MHWKFPTSLTQDHQDSLVEHALHWVGGVEGDDQVLQKLLAYFGPGLRALGHQPFQCWEEEPEGGVDCWEYDPIPTLTMTYTNLNRVDQVEQP